MAKCGKRWTGHVDISISRREKGAGCSRRKHALIALNHTLRSVEADLHHHPVTPSLLSAPGVTLSPLIFPRASRSPPTLTGLGAARDQGRGGLKHHAEPHRHERRQVWTVWGNVWIMGGSIAWSIHEFCPLPSGTPSFVWPEPRRRLQWLRR